MNSQNLKSPIIPLYIDGFGEVYIKDESVHPWSGTHKDRIALEIIKAYKNLELSLKNKNRRDNEKPQFSLISSGSAAIAIGRVFKEYGYPPLKVLADISLQNNFKLCSIILESNCELYFTNLAKKPLNIDDTLRLTNNRLGFDLTDFQNTSSIFNHGSLVYEILNEKPNYIFTPYGSGALFRNIIKIIKDEVSYEMPCDSRMNSSITQKELRLINIVGATSERVCTRADKLFAPYHRPYQDRNEHKDTI